MGRYRKVDSSIWNDAKFSSLSDRGKLVFLFLLTHPSMTSLGAMRSTAAGLAEELGWSIKIFRKAVQESISSGMVVVDLDAHYVELPNFLRYNGPESPNVVRSWAKAIDLIPECSAKSQLVERVGVLVETFPNSFREALPESFTSSGPDLSNVFPNPEQEQEQEQEPEQEPDNCESGPSGADDRHIDSTSKPRPGSEDDLASKWRLGWNKFYEQYPRKQKAVDGRKAWMKLMPQKYEDLRPKYDNIMAALDARIQDTWADTEQKYIPLPANFLTSEEFDDDEDKEGVLS